MLRYFILSLCLFISVLYCESSTCTLKIAVCIDISTYNKTSSYINTIDVIKYYIEYDLIDFLSLHNAELAIYTYSDTTNKLINHTLVNNEPGRSWIKSKLNDIILDFNTTSYSNWHSLYDTLYNDYYNNLILFFNNGYSIEYDYTNDTLRYNIQDVIPKANAISSKIISIGMDAYDVNSVTNIQSISGPIINKDYVIMYNTTYQSIRNHLTFIKNYTCCSTDKDQCGICHGNNDTCHGCDGIIGSNKEYDVCGVCGGDSSNCNVPPCHVEANITVKDYHKCKCVYSICSNVEWVKNVWLQSGDLIVEFVTFIHKHSPYDNVYLSNVRMVTYEETGIPYHFIYHDTDCQKQSDINYCRQTWRLRTYGATGVLNFSGVKPVEFDLIVNGQEEAIVRVDILLNIFRLSDPKIYNLIGSGLKLYYDDKFYKPYINVKGSLYINTNNDFIEGEYIYGEISSNDDRTLLNIDKILLCTGKNGNLLEYNPSSPHSTGCNTKTVDVIVIGLYDKGNGYTNDIYDFSFITHTPSPHNSIYFKYKSKIFSYYDQMIQVYWSNSIQHHFSRSIPIEMAEGNRFYRNKMKLNKELTNQISHYETYTFNYPKALYMRPLHETIVAKYKDTSNNLVNDLTLKKKEAEANNVNTAIYNVSCGKDSTWIDNIGVCQHNDYDVRNYNRYKLGYNYLLLILILLVFVFSFVWFCNR